MRPSGWFLVAAAAVAAAIAVVLLAVAPWVDGSDSATPPPPATTAAQLAQTMNDALRATASLRSAGTLQTRSGRVTVTIRFSLAQDDAGDFRLDTQVLEFAAQPGTTTYRRRTLVYHAAQRFLYERQWRPAVVGPDGELTAVPRSLTADTPRVVSTLLADAPSFLVTASLGPPFYPEALDPSVQATIRAALAAAGNVPVSAATTDTGSPTWTVSVSIPWPPDASAEPAMERNGRLTKASVVVDQQSGLVTRLGVTFSGGATSLVEYTDHDRNVEMPEDLFHPGGRLTAPPRGSGFSTDPIEAIAARERLEPLAPTFVLSGFRLTEAVVGRQPADAGPRDTTGLWQVYRCGLESFVLRQQKLTDSDAPDFAAFAGHRQRRLDHGELAGRPAEIWVSGTRSVSSDFSGPGLWSEDLFQVVRLAGDLTPYESWQVANSLQPR